MGQVNQKKFWQNINFIIPALALLVFQHHIFISYITKADNIINTKVSSSLVLADFPFILLLQLFAYLILIIAIHVIIALSALLLIKVLKKHVKVRHDLADALGLAAFISFWGTILLSNSQQYPRSIFAYSKFYPLGIDLFNLMLMAAKILSVLALIILFTGLLVYVKSIVSRSSRAGWILFAITAVFVLLSGLNQAIVKDTSIPHKQPNIILIGIDSLMLQENTPQIMPFLNNYLTDSVVFDNAYTSHARTFPSWMSILSGKHPLNTGARINLLAPEEIDKSRALQHDLADQGYQSLFAIDEVRFSNMDSGYGFNQMLSPKIGVADFIIGVVSDLPEINLLRNFSFSKYLLPYHYINRAMFEAYEPELFSRALSTELKKIQQRPVLLAIHYCLPHWPYVWREKRESNIPNPGMTPEYILPLYRDTLKKVDSQVKVLFSDLERNGYLDNAIVVLFSDHGESLGHEEDLPYTSYIGNDFTSLKQRRFGHGTNIFVHKQYEVLLSFKKYGKGKLLPGVRSQLSSTMDIAPTILDMLAIQIPADIDGISLLPWIEDENYLETERDLFVETGFGLPALHKINPSPGELLQQGLGYYTITDAGRLVINTELKNSIIYAKQIGIRNNQGILGTFTIDKDTVNLYFSLFQNEALIQINESNFDTACEHICETMLRDFISFYGKEAKDKVRMAIGNELLLQLFESEK